MAESNSDPTIARDQATLSYRSGSFVPPAPAELNARLPNLEVTELLGHGGMGVVYKGRHPLLDRLVAIKVVRPDFQTDVDFQSRFLREARTLAKLRHPYIVTVHDLGRLDDLYYLVMEFVEGSSLRQRLIDRSITERDTIDFVPQIAEALQHAHENGVIHRDVKPENILIDSRGRVRLVDFGLATLFGPQVAPSPDDYRVAGTLGYMAPEQMSMPEAVDHRADIYSTGVVFYEMLAGQLPKADRVPPSQKSGTDSRLDPIVLRALERERERRYQEARVLHSEVTTIARTPESSIHLEQHVAAPVERVFEAWTDPRLMATWLAPSDEFGPTEAEVDLQVDGSFEIRMRPPGQEQPSIASGQYCRVKAPHTLSFTWGWSSPHFDTHETQITLDFHSRGATTDVTLTHERFRDRARRDSHAKGWQGCLERLARVIGS